MFFIKFFLLFIMFSFTGWLIEILFVYIDQKVLVNRGFLFGPYLPIYGFGSLLYILVLKKYYSEPYVIFFGSLIISFILEYLTSYILELIFHEKWWDYSEKKYNINGRVCLETLIPFGLFSLICIYIIYPFYLYIISKININILIPLTILIFVLYVIDSICSIFITLRIKNINYEYKNNKNLKRITKKINNKEKREYERNNNIE